ncbi:MAG TPA: carboxypeptidase-like regulatory domain-containing protein [Silvibacterium sp.]|nr:carboxypeptidase-like regulatory domain-containing protein [Silvibacterium sp.]
MAEKQAQWFVGRNPFSASIMYGEGYDWTPLYSVRSGEMVGAFPVGIETKADNDAPYWPTQICWTYKEVWTQPVGEWIWLMRDLNGSAVVRGVTDKDKDAPVVFHNPRTGLTRTATPVDGTFRLLLPQGTYTVREGTTQTTLTVLSGGTYRVELRHDKALDFEVATEAEGTDGLVLRLSARGEGKHLFSIRADNLEIGGPDEIAVNLDPGRNGDAVWHARIVSRNTPWIAVIIPDGAIDRRREVSGASGQESRR